MSPERQQSLKQDALDELLTAVQRLEARVDETAKRVKLAWARSRRIPPSPKQRRQFKAATADLANILSALERVEFEVPEPTVSEEDRDRAIANLQALFSHIPPGVSLADELIADRRREAEREAREMSE